MMSDRNCWEVNPGCGYGELTECNDECPAYRVQLSCWEFDWSDFAKTLDSDSQDFWGNFFKEQCSKCTLYPDHRHEMDAVISQLLNKTKV